MKNAFYRARRRGSVILGPDGLPVRRNRRYAADKLSFFDRWLPPALKITRKKIHRHYVDFFAGYGAYQDENEEFCQGSPIKALTLSPDEAGFTHATFVNLDEEAHYTLQERVRQVVDAGKTGVPWSNVRFILGDANEVVEDVLSEIHPRAFVFAFIDPEQVRQWHWSTVQKLGGGRHESVDIYMLLPLEMGIFREMGYDLEAWPADDLDTFVGSREWENLKRLRTSQRRSREMRAAFEKLYVRRLRQHWSYAGRQRKVYLRGNQALYRMIFATNNEHAWDLAEWEVSGPRPRDPQLSLDL